VATIQCKSCGHDNPSQARFCANCGANLAASVEQPVPTVITSAEPAPGLAVEYMGFWIRLAAAIIDGVIISAISFVLSHITIGAGTAFWIPLAWLYHWLFIGLKGQTLGKMVLGIKVVNAAGSQPGLGEAALREVLGKIVSSVVIYIGFLWIIWDGQKQGWHDKIASTHVIRVELRI
jgi:uncharacterized RDD family membrane protein YckC